MVAVFFSMFTESVCVRSLYININKTSEYIRKGIVTISISLYKITSAGLNRRSLRGAPVCSNDVEKTQLFHGLDFNFLQNILQEPEIFN